jgi:hypothetical protein
LVIAVLDEIAGALERGKRVESRGVGLLTVKQKGGQQGRNPRSGGVTGSLVPQGRPVLLSALEQDARRHRDPVHRRRIESLVAGVHNLGRIGHARKNLLAGLDRIELPFIGKPSFSATDAGSSHCSVLKAE